MKHLFIPYEIALLAKEKGFDESCIAMWDHWMKHKEPRLSCPLRMPYHQIHARSFDKTGIIAPMYSQLIDWFRQKHNIVFEVKPTFHCNERKFYPSIHIDEEVTPLTGNLGGYLTYDVPNEAYNALFIKAFKLI